MSVHAAYYTDGLRPAPERQVPQHHFHFRRLTDGSVEVRASHPRDGLTLVTDRYSAEEWNAIVAAVAQPYGRAA